MKQYNNETMKNGFTLLEVIIAVSLLITGITGVFVLINKTIGLMSVSPSELIAAYLAQEGIEIVRNIRDTSWVKGKDWDVALPEDNWEVDYTTIVLASDGVDSCSSAGHHNCELYSGSPLKLASTGFYNYDSGDNTQFRRKITISKADLDGDSEADMMTVTVRVEWEEKRKTYNFSVQEYLYDWH